MASLTVNPSLDGYVQRDGGGTSWSTNYVLWDGESGSGGSAVVSPATQDFVRNHKYNTGGEFTIQRCFLLFDTSALPTGATISAAKIRIYVTNKYDGDNDAYAYLNVFSSNPASNSTLAVADIDQVGSTKFASDVDITGISTSAYLEISLNASGIATISDSGISKFSIREGHDVDNNAIDAAGDVDSGIIFTSVTSASNKPELVITYTTPVTATLTDGIKMGDVLTPFKVALATLTEGIKVGDLLVAARARVSSIIDGLKIGDLLSLTLIQITSWTNRTKPSTTFTNRIKPSTTFTDRTKPTTTWTKKDTW